MPGNAGGGKDPCFWCAGERGNRAVIDDESTTPRNSADLSIPLCRSAKRIILGAVARHYVVWTARVCAAVKPVGKPDAQKGHVRLCVQRRLACSVGIKPTEVRVRSLVAWIAGRRETKFLKPIDGIILGVMASHRAVTRVNA